MSAPRATIVIPAFNEVDNIVPTLARIEDAVTVAHEIVVVVDRPDDLTIGAVHAQADRFPGVRVVVQEYAPGPAGAIRYGVDQASAPCVVVTMADGSDDVRIIDDLVRLVERGCAVAAASRYMAGGAQIGGPRLKSLVSRAAGLSLHLLAGVGTRDATNSFKAYSTAFVRRVGIDSSRGFEIGIELVAKARRLRLPVAELPTIWLDRAFGNSNFKILAWLPAYLSWYRLAFGRRLDDHELGQRAAALRKAPS